MLNGDVDAELRRLAGDPSFKHRDSARHALQFRAGGDVAELVAIADDPHPCALVDTVFAMASAKRQWLNWIPMPSEAICNVADEVAGRRAQGEELGLGRLDLSAAEPPSAMTAAFRVLGPVELHIEAFPDPDIRVPLQRGRHAIWRYDGTTPVPAVPAPSAEAVRVLHEAGGEPWQSPIGGHAQAAPFAALPLADLLGLLAHLPGPPDTPRWEHLARSTPTYWYRLMQAWVCLDILRHAEDEPWETSTRRAVLVDLALGIEDWAADSALFALVTAAYRDARVRPEVLGLVRTRLARSLNTPRVVTIEESLAHLMLITPGSTADDRAVARAVLNTGEEPQPEPKRRWWSRR